MKVGKAIFPPRPSTCPVCHGTGTVPHDFYSKFGYGTHTTPVTCKSCEGKGVLWPPLS